MGRVSIGRFYNELKNHITEAAAGEKRDWYCPLCGSSILVIDKGVVWALDDNKNDLEVYRYEARCSDNKASNVAQSSKDKLHKITNTVDGANSNQCCNGVKAYSDTDKELVDSFDYFEGNRCRNSRLSEDVDDLLRIVKFNEENKNG